MPVTPATNDAAPKHILIKAPAENPSQPAASANPAPSASAYPPQSAAYPAMPSVGTRGSESESKTSVPVTSPPSESGSEEQVATQVPQASDTGDTDCPPQSSSSDDTVIAGRIGSSNGTIAVPSGQTTVPWPAVSGAPPGYPGDWHITSRHD